MCQHDSYQCDRAGKMDFEEKLIVHAQLEILMSELNNLAGFGGALIFMLMSSVALSTTVALIKIDSGLGIPLMRVAPPLFVIAAVAIAFGFSGFKQLELLRAESVIFITEQEQAANVEGRLWDSRSTYLWGKRMIGRNFRRCVLGFKIGNFMVVDAGLSAIWIQQVVENVISFVFMVDLSAPSWLMRISFCLAPH